MSEYNKIDSVLTDEKDKLDLVEFEPFVSTKQKKINQRLDEEDQDGDSDTGEGDGGDAGAGSITLSIEQLNAYLLVSFTKERRKWQQEFGPSPFTDDPNNLLTQKASQHGSCAEQPLLHPLLAETQQFSGDDPKLTAIPLDNHEAIEEFPKLRLANQLRKSQSLGLDRSKSVTLYR